MENAGRRHRPNTHPIVRRINLQGAGIHRQIAGDGGGGEGGGGRTSEDVVDRDSLCIP